LKKPTVEKFNFKPIGSAIKANRISMNLTQEKVADIVDCERQHYGLIENGRQHPSLQLMYDIAQLLKVSVDEFFLPNKERKKTSKRNLVDSLLDQLTDNDLLVIEGAAKGLIESRKRLAENNTTPVQ
jgi:DNA-binding XRE family transcriptional regulator